MRCRRLTFALTLAAAAASLAARSDPACAQAPASASADPSTGRQETPGRSRDVRLRLGLSLGPVIAGGGGPEDRGTNVWPALGGALDVQLGAQLHDLFAIYYQAGLVAAGSVEACVDSVIGSTSCEGGEGGLVLHTSSVVAELTLADGLQAGLGVSIVAGALGLDLSRDGTVRAGGLLRVGWAFGGRGPGTRQGLFVGAQLLIADRGAPAPGEPLVAVALAVGWSSF